MNILRQNTNPSFEIVSRIPLSVEDVYDMEITSEFTQQKQTRTVSVEKLPNENYLISLSEMPSGKLYEKFSFKIENICMGKMMIVSELEDIQNYETKTNQKYYH